MHSYVQNAVIAPLGRKSVGKVETPAMAAFFSWPDSTKTKLGRYMIIIQNGVVDFEFVCLNELEAQQVKKKYKKGVKFTDKGREFTLADDISPCMEEEGYYTFLVTVELER